MIRNKVLIFTLTAYIVIVVLLTFAFENFKWHGKGCAIDTSHGICNGIYNGIYNGHLEQNRTEYFVSLSACRSALEGKYPIFLCASGPDPSRPEVMMYLAFRNVFYSEYGKLESREVPLSFHLLPLGVLFAVISSSIAIGCTLAVRTILKTKQANNKSEPL